MRDDADPIERRRKQRAARQMRTVVIVVGIASGLLFLVIAIVFAPMLLRKTPAVAILGPDMTMTAQELIDRTAGNPTVMAPHNGKTIRLSGKFHRVSGNMQNQTFMYFENETGRGDALRCWFEEPAELAGLRKGDAVTVQGLVAASGTGVDIVNCRLIR